MTRTLSLKELRYPITSIIIKRSVIFNHISVINYYTFIVPKRRISSSYKHKLGSIVQSTAPFPSIPESGKTSSTTGGVIDIPSFK